MHRRLKWSAAGISLMTGLSRVLGYVRDQLQARFMGTTHEADAFFIAFLIPNMLRRLVGEGSLTAAFIPVYTRWRDKADDDEAAWRLVRVVMTDLFLILAVLTLLGIVLAPFLVRVLAPGFTLYPEKLQLAILLNRWMFPFIFFIGAAALSMAVLNSHRVFVWPAAMPIFFNLSIIAMALYFAQRWPRPSYAFATGVVLGGAAQFILQWPALRRQGFRYAWTPDFQHTAVREIFRLMVPGFFAVGIAQVNMTVGQIFASTLGEGGVSALYYAGRVQELTIGMIAVAYSTVLLPHLSAAAARADWQAFGVTVADGMVWVLSWSLPAVVGLMWVPGPILHTLFEYGRFNEISRNLSAGALFWYALGIPAYSLVKVLVPSFYSLKDMWTPIRAAFFSMATYILALSFLVGPQGVAGIALSNSLAAWVQVLILAGVYRARRLPLPGALLGRGSARIGAGLLVMGLWLYTATRWLPFPFGVSLIRRFSHLGLWIGPAAGLYFLVWWGVGRRGRPTG